MGAVPNSPTLGEGELLSDLTQLKNDWIQQGLVQHLYGVFLGLHRDDQMLPV